jgi:hypothetical protein
VAVPVAWRPMAVPAVPMQVFGEGLTRVTQAQIHREIREAMFASPRHACFFCSCREIGGETTASRLEMHMYVSSRVRLSASETNQHSVTNQAQNNFTKQNQHQPNNTSNLTQRQAKTISQTKQATTKQNKTKQNLTTATSNKHKTIAQNKT